MRQNRWIKTDFSKRNQLNHCGKIGMMKGGADRCCGNGSGQCCLGSSDRPLNTLNVFGDSFPAELATAVQVWQQLARDRAAVM